MMNFCYVFAVFSFAISAWAEDLRLVDLPPEEAQQHIESKDQTLKYAPKIESNVPAVRVLVDTPTNVLEDIYLANQYHGQDGLGGYLYGYSVPDIAKTEKKKPDGDLKGAYQYINNDGQEIKVQYWDDGTGFHQIDNLPEVLPKQVEDSPDVQAAKDEFFKRWHEEAERNSKPVFSPLPGTGGGSQLNQQYQPSQIHGQYSSNIQSGQYPSGVYEAGTPTGSQGQQGFGQYQSGGQNQGQYQPGQSQYQSSHSQSQSGQGQYQPGPSQVGQGQYQPEQSQPGQGYYQTGQIQPGQGQYQTAQSQYQPSYSGYQGDQNPGQSSGQYPTGQSNQNQLGPNQGQTGVQYEQNQASGSVSQPGQGGYQSGPSQLGHGQYQSSQSSSHGYEQAPHGSDHSAQYQPNNEWEYKQTEEEKGPPKGFFYNFDYPVGIIVQKQGEAGGVHKRESLENLYSQNKDNYDHQLKTGVSSDGSSQSGYQVHL